MKSSNQNELALKLKYQDSGCMVV